MASPYGDSQFQPVARHGSVFNFSFDHHEVQSLMGNNNICKPLRNMNSAELVKNHVVSGSVDQEGQVVQNPSSSSSSSSPPAPCLPGNINLNGRLNKKTIDEVCKEIVHHDHVSEVDNNQSGQQQLALGETTLDEFLLRAGVINNQINGFVDHQPLMGIDPVVVVSQHAHWLQLQMAATAQQQQQMTVMDTGFNVCESVYENPVADIGYSENHQLALTMPVTGIIATPSDSKANNESKRKYADEIMEKTIERRQKRMIKNRESAARSRARKQAYTNQLENQVSWLREKNNWLKKQKEVEMLLSSYPTPKSKYQLRRASSF